MNENLKRLAESLLPLLTEFWKTRADPDTDDLLRAQLDRWAEAIEGVLEAAESSRPYPRASQEAARRAKKSPEG